MHRNFIYSSNKEKTLSDKELSDTRVLMMLTPGCWHTRDPGVRGAETRVSDRLFIQWRKI